MSLSLVLKPSGDKPLVEHRLLPISISSGSSGAEVYGNLRIEHGALQDELSRRIASSFVKSSVLKSLEVYLQNLEELRARIVDDSRKLATFLGIVLIDGKPVLPIRAAPQWLEKARDLHNAWNLSIDRFVHAAGPINRIIKPGLATTSLKFSELEGAKSARGAFFSYLNERFASLTLRVGELHHAPGIEVRSALSPLTENFLSLAVTGIVAARGWENALKEDIEGVSPNLFRRGVVFAKRPNVRAVTIASVQRFNFAAVDGVVSSATRTIESYQIVISLIDQLLPSLKSDVKVLLEKEQLESRKVELRLARDGHLGDLIEQRQDKLDAFFRRQVQQIQSPFSSEKSLQFRVGYLLEQLTEDSISAYQDILRGVSWPEFRRTTAIVPGLKETWVSAGFSAQLFDDMERLLRASEDQIHATSIDQYAELRLALVLPSITPKDVVEAKREIVAAVNDEMTAIAILERYPQIFTIAHCSSPTRDRLGDLCFNLLCETEELNERNSGLRNQLENSLWEMVSDGSIDSFVANLINCNVYSAEAVSLLERTAQKLKANYARTVALTEKRTPVVKSSPSKVIDPETIRSQRRKQIKDVLERFESEDYSEAVISENNNLLDPKNVNFPIYLKLLEEVLSLSVAAQRPDISVIKHPELFCSDLALSRIKIVLEKQVLFNSLISEVEKTFGEDIAPYLFNLMRRGFYYSGSLYISRGIPTDFILDNACKGDLPKQTSRDVFSRLTNNALRTLVSSGVSERSGNVFSLNASAVGSEQFRSLGRLLGFVVNELDSNDRVSYRGYYL